MFFAKTCYLMNEESANNDMKIYNKFKFDVIQRAKHENTGIEEWSLCFTFQIR